MRGWLKPGRPTLYRMVGEYSNVVGRYGPGSERTKEIRAKYGDDEEFMTYADALDRIKARLKGSGIDYPPKG